MQTRGVWGIEVSELDAMSRMEVSRIKAFITTYNGPVSAALWQPHNRKPEVVCFLGTTNADGYLKDETGGRGSGR